MVDEAYQKPVLDKLDSPQTKEFLSLVALSAAHLPLAPVAPFFVGTVVYHAAKYYRVHKKAHLDPDWAKEHLPWHYDHHMGKDQDMNWGVTYPYFDHLMGTREKYVGTRAHQASEEKRVRRARQNQEALADSSPSIPVPVQDPLRSAEGTAAVPVAA